MNENVEICSAIFLILLVIPDLIQARPDEETPKEWREVQLEKPVIKSVVASKKFSCEVEIIDLDPEFPIYFVETSCLSWALTIIPNPAGVLYCNLGFWADDDTFAIFSAPPGNNGLNGFQYCSEV